MEDTDPGLIDEICGQDENDKNHFEKGRRRWWMGPDLIFVTNITNIISGEKIVMWRNFSFPRMTIVGELKISPHVEPKSTFVKKK